jgi:hypothetical protein
MYARVQSQFAFVCVCVCIHGSESLRTCVDILCYARDAYACTVRTRAASDESMASVE